MAVARAGEAVDRGVGAAVVAAEAAVVAVVGAEVAVAVAAEDGAK